MDQDFQAKLAQFFNECAHSNLEHRLWLLEKFESFWGIKFTPEQVASGLKEPEGRNVL